jgi:transposase
MRASLSQEASRIGSRIQKALEDANVKLASAATNVLGKSGRAMLEDIITGEDNPEHLASLAPGRLPVKIPITTCSQRKDPFPSSLSAVEHEIALLEERLEDTGRQKPELSQAVARWDTIPGVDRVALLAEVGDNMAQFPTAEQLATWAALCPGNHESAGKRLHGATPQGSPWLRRMACQCAWAAARIKNLSREARQEESRHRRGTYPHSQWLSLAEEPKQLRRSWRKLLRSHPLRRSQAVFGEAAPARLATCGTGSELLACAGSHDFED